MIEYIFYIGLNPFDSKSQKINERPTIFKMENQPILLKIQGEEMEGPFFSIANLKKKSKIYSQINNLKTQQSILKTANISEIAKITLLPFEHSYKPAYIKLFLHVWIGEIYKNDVSGIHFYNEEKVKILEVLKLDKDTQVYSAMISYYDKGKDVWINKTKPTNFFPDSWTLQKLFKELDAAFRNKIHEAGYVYYGFTSENIKVKIIIKNFSALTMYPDL